MNSLWDIIKDTYYNNTKYENEPHYRDWIDNPPIMQKNNPDYKGHFIGSSYYNTPKLWGNPPSEERYWSDPNVKRVFPDYFNEVKSILKDRFGYGHEIKPNDYNYSKAKKLTGDPRYKK